MSRKRWPIKANWVMISKIMPQTNQLESTNGVSSREPESHFIDVLNTKAGSDCCGTQQNGRGSDVRIRHLQVATRVVTYTRYSCYERWFTYINPCQLESSRKTSGNVKLVNWTKENRKSRAENRLVKPRRILVTLTLWYSCSYAEQISKSNK